MNGAVVPGGNGLGQLTGLQRPLLLGDRRRPQSAEQTADPAEQPGSPPGPRILVCLKPPAVGSAEEPPSADLHQPGAGQQADGLLDHVKRMGERLRHGIEALGHPLVAGVRGAGLLLGVTLTGPKSAALNAALADAGYLAKYEASIRDPEAFWAEEAKRIKGQAVSPPVIRLLEKTPDVVQRSRNAVEVHSRSYERNVCRLVFGGQDSEHLADSTDQRVISL